MAVNPIGQYALQGGTVENPIPKEWRDLGYSGHFTVMMRMVNDGTDQPAEPDRVAVQAAKMPYELTRGWLALAVEHVDGFPHMVLVRRDESAIVDLVTGPRLP